MTPRDISVIIPALNEADHVAAAVSSAIDQSAGEVVVVDGSSHDATASRAQAAGARVLASAAGRAVQQNAGAATVHGDILLFLHADNRLGGGCLAQICKAFCSRPDAWGGAFRHRIDASNKMYRMIEWGDTLRSRLRGIPFGDQGIFVRRDVFESVGGFPDEPLMEDILLMKRLRQNAWPLLLDGPVWTNPRRWQQHGILRQTMRNWSLQLAHACGCSPRRLAAYYRNHDVSSRKP